MWLKLVSTTLLGSQWLFVELCLGCHIIFWQKLTFCHNYQTNTYQLPISMAAAFDFFSQLGKQYLWIIYNHLKELSWSTESGTRAKIVWKVYLNTLCMNVLNCCYTWEDLVYCKENGYSSGMISIGLQWDLSIHREYAFMVFTFMRI